MNPEAERLIDLATRPLADNAELRLSAEAELRKSLEAHAADRPDAIKEAADSLAHADLHPKRGRWKVALYVVMLLVSLPLIAHTARQIYRSAGIRNLISAGGSAAAPGKIPNLGPAQSLLLYGDERATNEADRWKPLWDSEPENPTYLAVYAAAYFKDHDKLSPEILAAAERIDPDNGWFLALAAAANAEDAVKREKRNLKDTKDGKAAVMTIRDEKLLDETLATLHLMAAKPRFASYQNELLRRQIPLFPPRRDWVSQIPLLAHVGSMRAPGISLRKLPDVLAAGAARCAAKGDIDGFRRIIGDWHSFVRHATEGGDTMIDVLVAKVTITGPAANFRDAARTLGLEEEERYFAELNERARNEKDARDKLRRTESAEHEILREKGSILGGLTAPLLARQVQRPPVYTVEDMRPARHADHALVGRALSGLGWTLFAIVIPCVFFANRRESLAARLSLRMTDLLRPWDWVRLMVGGVVFPVLWYLAITRLTPLTAREWSVTWLMFMPVGGQFVSFTLSLFILPSLIASELLAKRAAAFGFSPRFRWLGWLAAVAALAGVPAFGAVQLYAGGGALMFAPAIFPACAVVAWILSGFAFGRAPRQLRRATLDRILLPACVASMLAFALLVPFHYTEEQYWIQRDRVGEISTDAPALSRFEYEVAQILRGEILEMLGDPPAVR